MQETLRRQTLVRFSRNGHVAWLTTILRNLFRDSEYPEQRCEVQDTDGRHLDGLIVPPKQHSGLEFEEFREALAGLPAGQREALLLVVACRFSYEEAAAICETPVGTIKSRVNRARAHLSKLIQLDADGPIRERRRGAGPRISGWQSS